jgi:DNA-binding LacI/PurR family transcriptional regulator
MEILLSDGSDRSSVSIKLLDRYSTQTVGWCQPMAAVTLQTIADELGVSRTTVSNAFSKPDQLSDELRRRILDTATRLGYTGPDPAARLLRRGRAGVMGVVLKESLTYAFGDAYALDFLGGLASEAETAGLGLLLIPCPPGAEQEVGVRDAVVDGFVVFSLPDRHPMVDATLARMLPTVFVDGPRRHDQPFVGIDDRAATADVARHLLDLGHRRVTVLTFRITPDGRTGPADPERIAQAAYRVTAERLDGALSALRDGGLDPPVYEVGVNTRRGARTAAASLLQSDAPPTALLCLSDQIALGAMDAAREMGVEVPGELSITGFDDVAEAETTGLTTISQPAAEKGARAGEMLRTGDTSHLLLPHTLRLRSTTAPPA